MVPTGTSTCEVGGPSLTPGFLMSILSQDALRMTIGSLTERLAVAVTEEVTATGLNAG